MSTQNTGNFCGRSRMAEYTTLVQNFMRAEGVRIGNLHFNDLTGNNRKFKLLVGFGLEERDGTSRRYPTKPEIMVINEARIKPVLTDFSTIMLSIDNNYKNLCYSRSNNFWLQLNRAKANVREISIALKGRKKSFF